MDQGSTRKRSAVHNFAPTVTKFCVMWEGQALPQDTKFGNCRCKIVGRRVIFIWSLIHRSSWSGLIKAKPVQLWKKHYSPFTISVPVSGLALLCATASASTDITSFKFWIPKINTGPVHTGCISCCTLSIIEKFVTMTTVDMHVVCKCLIVRLTPLTHPSPSVV